MKSSAELCEEFGLTDIALNFTEADYLNLTNYGLFVRMVRPQVQQVRPKPKHQAWQGARNRGISSESFETHNVLWGSGKFNWFLPV